MKKCKLIFWCVANRECTLEVLRLHGSHKCLWVLNIFVRQMSADVVIRNSLATEIYGRIVRQRLYALGEAHIYAVLINCTATLNIITATIRSSRRQVVGRASHGASQAAPIANVENHTTDALAAPAT